MSSKTASALVARVVEQLERGDTAGAEVQARKLRETVPDDAELARLHGVALLLLDRNAEACTVLREALTLEPASVAVQSNLASALMATGAPDEAVGLLRKTIAGQPGDPALRNNLANALRAAGDDEGAREAYLAALALAPGYFDAIVNLAATELSLGWTAEAEARLRDVLAGQPHPQALLLLGHALNRQQRYAEAQAVYGQAAQLAPNAAQFPYQAGLMADEQHHFGEAVQLYRRALQLDPNLHLAEGQLLFVLRRECDWDAAEPLSRRIKARALDGSGSIDPFA
ncbi:MAG: tetratricopeptide repeat protein, partial [Xanthomonadaceae bacterium]|nr:tetratricopeptide repeat protein [Xanthomonadaceae bacterium]